MGQKLRKKFRRGTKEPTSNTEEILEKRDPEDAGTPGDGEKAQEEEENNQNSVAAVEEKAEEKEESKEVAGDQ